MCHVRDGVTRREARLRWGVRVSEVFPDLCPVRDGVARREANDPVSEMGVDNPEEVATNPHHDTTVATIDATGFTSTGIAMALECTHTPIGSRVFHAPTTRPACSAAPMAYSGSDASSVCP